jgi:hypothetical protein
MEDKKNRPDYCSVAYEAMAACWMMVADVFGGTKALRAKGKAYLPQEPAEDNDSYQTRLSRAVFFNCFKRTVRGLTGLVFHEPPTLAADVDGEIAAQLENADLAGTHWTELAKDLFAMAVRDGHAFLMVDMPPRLTESSVGAMQPTLADERAAEHRPYWRLYDARQAMNWSTRKVGGRTQLAHITFCEKTVEPDGRFGEKEVTRYRVLWPGGWELYRQAEKEDELLLEAAGQFLAPGGQPLPDIPLAAVTCQKKKGHFVSEPPLLELAYLNVRHYQLTSDLDNVIHLSCVPLLWAKGRDKATPMQPVGASILIDLQDGPDSALGYAEITGAGIVRAETRITALERQMAVMGLEMLAEKDAAAQTATEVRLSAAESASELAGMANNLKDALENALMFHAQFLGVKDGGSVELRAAFDTLTLTEEQMREYRSMVNDRQLSLESLWAVLKRARRLPADFDAKQEVARLDGDKAAGMTQIERDALPGGAGSA